MNDTPRTDAEYERLFGIYQNAERINGPLCCAFENDMRLCGQLERELNAANQRIKRLEEAGDELIEYLKHRIKTEPSNPIWHTASIKWGKVKNELKP